MKKKLALIFTCLLLVTGCGNVELKDGESAVTTFKEGGISAETLYGTLKDKYGIETLIELIDTDLLEREFDTTDAEKNYIKQYVNSVKTTVKNEEYDLESYLDYYYGVSTIKELESYYRLNYRRTEWFRKHAVGNVSDKELNTYYEKMTIGDINLSWILVQVDAPSNATTDQKTKAEKEALATAKDAIKELKDGAKFADVVKKYSDDSATIEKGGLVGDVNRGDISDVLIEEAIKLKKGKYSTTPIQTEQGYVILLVNDKKDKPAFEDVKDSIRTTIGEEKVNTDNGALYLESLEALRSKYEMTFKDTELSNEYTDYMNKLKKQVNAK